VICVWVGVCLCVFGFLVVCLGVGCVDVCVW